ncbi:hypothetical protein ACWCPZ_37770, partial [Streptomyces sp. NPDC002402]
YLLPVVSVLLGAVVLGEDLSVRVVLGMAVVLAGVGMTRRQGAAAEAVAAAEEPAVEESATPGLAPDLRSVDAEPTPEDRPAETPRPRGQEHRAFQLPVAASAVR